MLERGRVRAYVPSGLRVEAMTRCPSWFDEIPAADRSGKIRFIGGLDIVLIRLVY